DLLNTGDARTQMTAFRDGKLYIIHSTACASGGSPNVSCLRLVIVDPSSIAAAPVGAAASPGVLSVLTLGAGTNKFLWMPNLAVTNKGNLVFWCQYSRSKTPLPLAFAGMKSGATKRDPEKVLTKGACALLEQDPGGRTRPGDYTGAALDPADNSFW